MTKETKAKMLVVKSTYGITYMKDGYEHKTVLLEETFGGAECRFRETIGFDAGILSITFQGPVCV